LLAFRETKTAPLTTHQEAAMRVGIFGGTFDPVHLGHLILAEQCREQGRLDQVWFVPAPRPPHKQVQPLTRFEQRVEMIQLAIAGQPAFRVEEIEKERTGPSFTVDTVAELRRRHPTDDFHLLVGSDTLAEIHTWYEPVRLLEMVGLLVMTRPGHPTRTADQVRASLHLPESATVRLQVVDSPLIDIASRDVRARAAAGRSLRYLLPRAVEVYVMEKHLYRTTVSAERT
jgi:nicotinate-nucleotide adenylyltransferase